MHPFAKAIIVTALATITACATPNTAKNQPEFVVKQENSYIPDRSLVRRISILDDDLLLIEVGARDLYRVQLLPGCIDFADIMTPVRLEDHGIGIDRGTRFVVGQTQCPVRAIDRVERIPHTPRAQQGEPETSPPSGS